MSAMASTSGAAVLNAGRAAAAAAARTTTSRLFMPSSRETAADSTPGHQLLLRAGYIRKVRMLAREAGIPDRRGH